MDIKEAIMAYAQSEKIKSAIIWISNSLEILEGLPTSQPQNGQRIIRALMDMVYQEIQLSKKVAGKEQWKGIEKSLDQAIVMINSGVGYESIRHLTQALSQVTNICHRSMSFLQEEGLI